MLGLRPLFWTLTLTLAACGRRESKPTPLPPLSAEHPNTHSTGKAAAPSPKPSPSAAPSAHAGAGRVESGRGLYERYCKLCHGPEAKGYAADNAPSLVTQSFLESASDAFIAHSIRAGRPNTPMGAYGVDRGGPLKDAQIDDIIAFLRSQGPKPIKLSEQPASGDAGRGKALYDTTCRACHGTETKRSTAPQLLNPEFLASATPGFMRHAILHGRPPTPMPAYKGVLRPQEIEDIVSYLTKQARSVTPQPPASASARPKEPAPVVLNPRGGQPKFTLRDGRYVSVEQVKDALAAKKRLVIVDARATSDWLQFRIPGSISVPYYEAGQLERIPNDGTWVVAYCACPHHASGEVVDALRRAKYPNTAVLDEGILVWRERGYPLEGAAVKKQTPAAPK